MEIMEEVPVMMVHLHHHHHHHHRGLVVAIREVVEDHLEIECDLMMIGKNHNCKENLLLDLNEKYCLAHLNILRYLTFIVSLKLNNPFLKSEKHSKSIASFEKHFWSFSFGIFLVNHLNHFVEVVEVLVRHLMVGVDAMMRMRIMIKMKIHQHLQIVPLLGHLVVDKRDEAVLVLVVDHWKIERNQMRNGLIMMIDLVGVR
jgi:hypothetical protein